MTAFNLRNVRLRPGEQFRDVVEVALEPLELGGQRYVPVPEGPEAVLTLTQTSSGLVLELELGVRILGPCMRCLADAVVDVRVEASEYHDSDPAAAPELRSEYVVDDQLEVSAWARDAIAIGLPEQILHAPDCAGLCPVCGKDLNVEPHVHEEAEPDPRWAALEQLRERL